MARILYPRAGKGRVILGGVVFTDGVAEGDFGPNTLSFLDMRGAVVIGSAEEMDEHTVDELRTLADRAGIHVPSHLHKADVIRTLRAEPVVDHEAEAAGSTIVDAEPQAPAGAPEAEQVGQEPAPAPIEAETSGPHPSEGAAETAEEDTGWQPSPPSTTSPTTTGSLSLQDRRRQSSQGA